MNRFFSAILSLSLFTFSCLGENEGENKGNFPSEKVNSSSLAKENCANQISSSHKSILKVVVDGDSIRIVTDNQIIYRPFNSLISSVENKTNELYDVDSFFSKITRQYDGSQVTLKFQNSIIQYEKSENDMSRKVTYAEIVDPSIFIADGVQVGALINEALGIIYDKNIVFGGNSCINQAASVLLFHPVEEFATIQFYISDGRIWKIILKDPEP